MYIGDSKIFTPGFLSPRDKKSFSRHAPTASIDLFSKLKIILTKRTH